MNPKPLGVVVAIVFLFCVAFVLVALRVRATRVAPSSSFAGPHAELFRLLREQPPGALFYVSLKEEPAKRWRAVRSSKPDEVLLDDGKPISSPTIRAFVVTYSSGEVLATSVPPPSPANLPEGAFFARPTKTGVGVTLTDDEVALASADVLVVFGPVRSSKSRGNIYETRVVNKGKTPIRITHFGAYTKRKDTWTLNTIVEGFFTAQQFREWYGVADDGWLSPGASGVDRENYGPNCLWVYFFETPDGASGKAIGRAPQ